MTFRYLRLYELSQKSKQVIFGSVKSEDNPLPNFASSEKFVFAIHLYVAYLLRPYYVECEVL